LITAIVNQKGGVAKTTTTINLGSCLAELGKKVLLIDIDPQGNLTQGLGVENIDKTIYECLTEELPLSEIIQHTNFNNLDIVPANIKLANAELELSSTLGRESLLKDALEHADLNYDYILIDCNPSLGILTVNALTATEDIIIPLEPGIFALEGIGQLVKVIQLIKKKLNPKLNIKGVLLTRVNSRTSLAKDFEVQLHEIFGDKVFNTVIHNNVKIAEAQTYKKPINVYDKNAKGSIEYMSLAKELISNEKQ
jgi:chromosome partitioning protein